jgi:D-amino-acid dehydrogenase
LLVKGKGAGVTQDFDTVVIGGGIVGWSAAYRLARNGASVAVIDNSRDGYATAAGAGIVSPGSGIHGREGAEELTKAAVGWYPTLVAHLKEDGQAETGFASPGTLFVFTDDAEYARLPEVKAFAERRRDAGMRSIGDISELSGAEARRLFPALADIPGALHMSEGSRVNGRLLRDALRNAAIARGAEEIRGAVSLDGANLRDRALMVDGSRVGFDRLLLAAGAWTCELAATVGIDVPVVPQRGQILHLSVPGTETTSWPVIHGFHNHYMLAFPTDRVVVGATREDGSGFDYRMTAGGIRQELDEALRVAPGLTDATLEEIRVGFRPMSEDGLPILGLVPGTEHVYVATGHGPSGLTLGPVSGAAVADAMLGHEPVAPLAPFSLARFAGAGDRSSEPVAAASRPGGAA